MSWLLGSLHNLNFTFLWGEAEKQLLREKFGFSRYETSCWGRVLENVYMCRDNLFTVEHV